MPVLRGMRKELVPSLLKEDLPRPVLEEELLFVPTTGAVADFCGIGAVGLGSGNLGGFGGENGPTHIINSPRLID